VFALINERRRERLADWLIVIGAVALFVSLFLTWSHQFSPAFLARWGTSDQLRGLPHNPTAWQLYSAVDVLFALLAGALVAVALAGNRAVRIAAVVAVAIALAFALHALSAPPTNGADVFDAAVGGPAYTPNSPAAGAGETVALVGLGLALVGLLVSFTAELPELSTRHRKF
jgi:hypothetical protein